MRTRFGVLSVMAVLALVVAWGSAPRLAVGDTRMMSENPVGKCELRFHSMDIGDKGYLTARDYAESYYGGIQNSRGRASGKVASKDTNGDGKVSMNEFCGLTPTTAPYPIRGRSR